MKSNSEKPTAQAPSMQAPLYHHQTSTITAAISLVVRSWYSSHQLKARSSCGGQKASGQTQRLGERKPLPNLRQKSLQRPSRICTSSKKGEIRKQTFADHTRLTPTKTRALHPKHVPALELRPSAHQPEEKSEKSCLTCHTAPCTLSAEAHPLAFHA